MMNSPYLYFHPRDTSGITIRLRETRSNACPTGHPSGGAGELEVVFVTQLSLSITSQKLELATAVRDSSDTRVMNGSTTTTNYVQLSTRIEFFTLNIFS
ncbi:Protein of unknown function [Pyronema omphalodes CBS 100304]|uniref:Uncharacterized protein n=1 Tax=Pyronema omphalodes (strain CBS 100304) TaxID=1076935 RepID=U4KUS9_PYROM|nr:Protein of unknown function [Pyronema omphalodes CBS 100304]